MGRSALAGVGSCLQKGPALSDIDQFVRIAQIKSLNSNCVLVLMFHDCLSQWTRGGRRHNNVNANINIFFFKYLYNCKYSSMANTNITTYKSDSFSKWTRGVRRHNNVNANTFFSPFASTIANILLIQIQIHNTKYN